jgi:hypothetical protein
MSKTKHEHILAFIQKKISEETLRQSLKSKKSSLVSKFNKNRRAK